jgi:hypothetical protein
MTVRKFDTNDVTWDLSVISGEIKDELNFSIEQVTNGIKGKLLSSS